MEFTVGTDAQDNAPSLGKMLLAGYYFLSQLEDGLFVAKGGREVDQYLHGNSLRINIDVYPSVNAVKQAFPAPRICAATTAEAPASEVETPGKTPEASSTAAEPPPLPAYAPVQTSESSKAIEMGSQDVDPTVTVRPPPPPPLGP